MQIRIRKLNKNAVMPQYKSEHASGLDIHACIDEELTIPVFERVIIPSGFAIELPQGYEAQIRTRSGLAILGVLVANSPGTIDADYRGEIKIILINLSNNPHRVCPHDRIAQMVIVPVCRVELVETLSLSNTKRMDKGFGSTGGF